VWSGFKLRMEKMHVPIVKKIHIDIYICGYLSILKMAIVDAARVCI